MQQRQPVPASSRCSAVWSYGLEQWDVTASSYLFIYFLNLFNKQEGKDGEFSNECKEEPECLKLDPDLMAVGRCLKGGREKQHEGSEDRIHPQIGTVEEQEQEQELN